MDEDVEETYGSVRRRAKELINERNASVWGFVSGCSKATVVDEVGIGVGNVRRGGECHGLNHRKSYLS